MLREELAREETIATLTDAVYDKLKENALGTIERRLDSIDGRLGGLETKVDEGFAHFDRRIEGLEGELRHINEQFAGIVERLP